MIIPLFNELTARYVNTAEHNDALHGLLTEATWGTPLLADHRGHVEKHKLGFGDAAFHALWASLLQEAAARFGTVRALEIGIFKGQVISLWSHIAKVRGLAVEVSALGPLRGQPRPHSRFRLLNALRYRLSRRYRERVHNGDFYPEENYEAIVRALFSRFYLNFDHVRLYRGFSTDPAILSQLRGQTFHLVYVDGDHSYEGALHDFKTFGAMVVPRGWLVADDASADLPGTKFWKGHEAVSRAVKIVPSLGFKNVLNVGHNRVFERVQS